MDANPFVKEAFSSYREWEEALLQFLVSESKNPNVENWKLFAINNETKKTACFTALFLSNIMPQQTADGEADALYRVYEELKILSSEPKEFEAWYKTGWLNVSRITHMLKVALKESDESGRN